MTFPKRMRTRHGKKVGWHCEYPGCDRGFKDSDGNYLVEFHHINPTSNGGKDTYDNIQCLCLYHHAKTHEQLFKAGIGHKNSANIVWSRYRKTKGGRYKKRGI